MTLLSVDVDEEEGLYIMIMTRDCFVYFLAMVLVVNSFEPVKELPVRPHTTQEYHTRVFDKRGFLINEGF